MVPAMTLQLETVDDLSALMAVGCLAVFCRTLGQRTPRTVDPQDQERHRQAIIHTAERRAFRAYFLRILHYFSLTHAVFEGGSGVPLLSLLENVLHRFATSILEIAVRIEKLPVDTENSQDIDLSHIEPPRVLASLERDLDIFWPGRHWGELRQPLELPTEAASNVPRLIVDLGGLKIQALKQATGPEVDWTEFGVKQE